MIDLAGAAGLGVAKRVGGSAKRPPAGLWLFIVMIPIIKGKAIDRRPRRASRPAPPPSTAAYARRVAVASGMVNLPRPGVRSRCERSPDLPPFSSRAAIPSTSPQKSSPLRHSLLPPSAASPTRTAPVSDSMASRAFKRLCVRDVRRPPRATDATAGGGTAMDVVNTPGGAGGVAHPSLRRIHRLYTQESMEEQARARLRPRRRDQCPRSASPLSIVDNCSDSDDDFVVERVSQHSSNAGGSGGSSKF